MIHNNITSYQNPNLNNNLNTNESAIGIKTTSPLEESVNNKINSERADSKPTDIHLSDRSTRLNALSNEFFKGGLTTVNIDKLVERAYEYGLINQHEFAKLSKSSNVSKTDTAELDEQTKTQSLAEYLAEFSKKILKVNEEADDDKKQQAQLISQSALAARAILVDVEQAKTSETFQQDLQDARENLMTIINSDSFSKMPVKDRTGLTQTVKALDVVQQLSPQRLTNNKVNQYLQVFNR